MARSANTLFPELPPNSYQEEIELAKLPDTFPGEGPDNGFIESIRRNGVLQPIAVVYDEKNDKYEVVAGRRRILASKKLEHERIPALIFPKGSFNQDVATLLAQRQKSNPVIELEAIEALVKQGHNETEIARATLLPVQVIRRRLRLQGLSTPMRKSLRAGGLKMVHAEQVARLSDEQQDSLSKTLKANGKIRGIDIRKIKLANRTASSEDVFDALDDQEEEATENSAQAEEISRLRQFCQLVGGAIALYDGASEDLVALRATGAYSNDLGELQAAAEGLITEAGAVVAGHFARVEAA